MKTVMTCLNILGLRLLTSKIKILRNIISYGKRWQEKSQKVRWKAKKIEEFRRLNNLLLLKILKISLVDLILLITRTSQ